MWLEADCNLISGESMIRQIIYGKRFFKEEFGVENRVLWSPDVFGYSAKNAANYAQERDRLFYDDQNCLE